MKHPAVGALLTKPKTMEKFEFNNLVSSETNSLKMYALRFTKNLEDADDLIQDTILKAITYSDKFQQGTNLKGWLYTIMRNTFINKYRKEKKKREKVIQTDEITSNNLFYSSTKNDSTGTFIMEDIQKALNELPEAYYTPFTLYFEGYKYREIAEEMDLPIGTVKTRIHVARNLLKKSLSTILLPT